MCVLLVSLDIFPNFSKCLHPLPDIDGNSIDVFKTHALRDFALAQVLDVIIIDAVSLFTSTCRPTQAVGPPGSLGAQLTEIKLHLLEVPLFRVDSLHSKAHLVTGSPAHRHPAHALGALFGSVPDALDLLFLGLDLLRQVSALLEPRPNGAVVRLVGVRCTGLDHVINLPASGQGIPNNSHHIEFLGQLLFLR